MTLNRRSFLKTTALAGATLAAPAVFAQSAAKKYRVALIGCGWYGTSDLLRLVQVAPVEVVALCDPDRQFLARTSGLVCQRQQLSTPPRVYGDYRELLREHELDLVLIGTPDHWHALQMIAAVEAGADVYVQKPISVDVLEGEAMVAAAPAQSRGASRHAAQEHSAFDRRQAAGRGGGVAGQDRPRGHVLLLPHAGQWQSARAAGPRFLRLRDVDRTSSAAAV